MHQLSFTPIKRSSGFGGIATEWYIQYPKEYNLCDHITLLELSISYERHYSKTVLPREIEIEIYNEYLYSVYQNNIPRSQNRTTYGIMDRSNDSIPYY